ncbi:DUF2937 family protein [Glaciecola sp. MF2-115]|uniref:DUF2937 family protein n=1 Tax=Glaciecola sp. MF2-115 TaxID=3384827 RepID=UPI0039A31F1B
MIFRTLDKLFFGITLVIALQVPQLADHYQQFLAGMHESSQWQINGYQETANRYNYASVSAMIEHHLQNDVASVRDDAIQKQQTIATHQVLSEGLATFQNGNLLQKLMFMLSPSGWQYVDNTLENFSFGLPITTEGILFGVVFGLFLNMLVSTPASIIAKRRRSKKLISKSKQAEAKT